MAFLAGLVATPAAGVGVMLGLTWWRRLRRAQGHTEGSLTVLPLLPPPVPPQEAPTMNRVSFANRKTHRQVRGRRG
jgi:hypothetical protein